MVINGSVNVSILLLLCVETIVLLIGYVILFYITYARLYVAEAVMYFDISKRADNYVSENVIKEESIIEENINV